MRWRSSIIFSHFYILGCVYHQALHPPRLQLHGPLLQPQDTVKPAAFSTLLLLLLPPAAVIPLAARSADSMTMTARPPAWWGPL